MPHRRADIPVVIFGVIDGMVTVDGSGWQRFTCLSHAQTVFPDLDPETSTERFTRAMEDSEDDQPQLRFETWMAYERCMT